MKLLHAIQKASVNHISLIFAELILPYCVFYARGKIGEKARK